MNGSNLVVLLESDKNALSFYNGLDQSIREQIQSQPDGIFSLEGLRNRAEYLRGKA